MGDGSSGWNGVDGDGETEDIKKQEAGDALAPIPVGGGVSRPEAEHDAQTDPPIDIVPKLDAPKSDAQKIDAPKIDATERKPSAPDPTCERAPDAAPEAGAAPPSPIDDAPPLGTRVPLRSRPAKHAAASKAQAERRDAPLFQVHSLNNFLSTSRIPRQLDALVAKCLARDSRLDHILIHGGPGSGTGLLAVALINDYAPRRVIEIDAALGCDADLVRRSIEDVGPRGVLFIRHIDALDAECDQMLAEALAGRPVRTRRPRGFVDPTESDLDRVVSASAAGREPSGEPAPVEFTLIATAHMMAQVGYILRTRVEHMFHLRDDPKALRNAMLRALRRHGSIGVEPEALPQLERVLKSLSDSVEPITRAALLRGDCDGVKRIDAALMQSILEEDLAARLPDEAYSSSLRRHLAGRKIEQVTPEEIARIDSETGWGHAAAEAALKMMLREESRRRPA